MKRFRSAIPARAGLLAAAVVTALLAGPLGGCAPKRVLREGQRLETAPRSGSAPKAGDNETERTYLLLPEPEFRGHTGQTSRRPPAGSGLGRSAVELARQQLGKPYQWGGAGPERFDCSGLVQYVYRTLGVDLPRVSKDQARAGVGIDRDELRPGDLLFFATSGQQINHVGIYIGNSKFIHAPRKHMPVRTESLNNAWWRRRFKAARRIE